MTGTAVAARLDDRYGRSPGRGRPGAFAVAALLVLAAVVWGAWTGFGGAAGSLNLQTTGYVVHGDRAVTVSWVVSGDPGNRLVCAIVATAPTDEVLGLKEVALPASGQADRSGTTKVRTTRRADSGLIRSCRRA